jgi:hypothetical protein
MKEFPDWIQQTSAVFDSKTRMINSLRLDSQQNQRCTLLPELNWRIWTTYSVAILAAFLIVFAFHRRVSALGQALFNTFSLVSIVLHQQYAIHDRSGRSLTLFTLLVIMCVWLFNSMLSMIINTDLISLDKNMIYDSLEQYLHSPLQPCWPAGHTCRLLNASHYT